MKIYSITCAMTKSGICTPFKEDIMSNLTVEGQYKLERWKIVLLTIGAITTFLTFFVPFTYQRERQMDQAFSETLQRLGDANPALGAGAAIGLVDFYRYRRFFGLGPAPYKKQCIFVLQNALKIQSKEVFVRQAFIEALIEMDPNAMQGAKLKGADLSKLDLAGISFRKADLSYANLSGATAGLRPVSFEGAVFIFTDMREVEFPDANFTQALLEKTNLSSARLEKATIKGAVLIGANLSHTHLGGAMFQKITQWDKKNSFEGADCENADFDTSSDFYKWGQSRFPECFKPISSRSEIGEPVVPPSLETPIQLTRQFLISRSWEFLHDKGDVISPQVRLDKSGKIQGVNHPNESSWRLEDGTLVFYHQSGVPSTRFSKMRRDAGKVILSGPLLLPGGHQPVVIHVLKEL